MKTQWITVYIGRDLDTRLFVLVSIDEADPKIGVKESIEIEKICFPNENQDIFQCLGASIIEEIQEQIIDQRDFIMENYYDQNNA